MLNLLKKYIKKENNTNNSIKSILEHNKNNTMIRDKDFIKFKEKTSKFYKEKGYIVSNNELAKEEGIDMICLNDDEIVLIQCKNSNKERCVNGNLINSFYNNAMSHINKHGIDEEQVVIKYVVPSKKIFDYSAIKLLDNKEFKCEYEII